MPKGDRLILKADPEDGTTPIANLLLDAVAIAKISGLQKGAILHLWRETYGWIGEDGKRRKECKISLKDWMGALDSSKSRTSEALTELEEKCIIKRRMADAWGGYYYSINTSVSKWNSNSINFDKLLKIMGIPNNGTVAQNGTIPESDNSSSFDNSSEKDNSTDKQKGTVAQNGTEQLPKPEHLTIYKESIKESINKDVVILEKDNNKNKDLQKYRKEIFKELKKRRQYNLSKGKTSGEAKTINWLFSQGYSVEDILKTYDKMKNDKFWQTKPLTLMSVADNVGEIIKNGQHTGEQQSIKHQSDIQVIGGEES